MKLNPAKCTFGVPAGKLLGFLVSSRGIEANPVKIRAIEKMTLPTCLKDVQKFTGCLASLSRFLSRLGDKALPLYALMKKADTFIWTPQADAAFRELKQMLASAPVLAEPLPKEPTLLYIAATNRVVSVVMVVEREEEGKSVQRPVYYLSEVLSTSKQNNPHYQKMTYGVYMAAKRLKHYFEEHPIKVVSQLLSRRSSVTKMQVAELPNGQSNYHHMYHSTKEEKQLSHRCWPTSSWTGQRCSMNLRRQCRTFGRCTLMAQKPRRG